MAQVDTHVTCQNHPIRLLCRKLRQLCRMHLVCLFHCRENVRFRNYHYAHGIVKKNGIVQKKGRESYCQSNFHFLRMSPSRLYFKQASVDITDIITTLISILYATFSKQLGSYARMENQPILTSQLYLRMIQLVSIRYCPLANTEELRVLVLFQLISSQSGGCSKQSKISQSQCMKLCQIRHEIERSLRVW